MESVRRVSHCVWTILIATSVFLGDAAAETKAARTSGPSKATAAQTEKKLPNRCPDISPLTDAAVAKVLNVTEERLAALKAARALSNAQICSLPDAGLKRAFAKLDKPKPDHPGDWAKFRNLQRRSEDGKVKPDGLIIGLAQRKSLMKSLAAPTGQPPPGAGISSDVWTSLGPGHVGGRIRAIAVHPDDTNRIWAGGVAGGIWQSSDAGASWSPVNDFMGNLSISSIVLDPVNPSVMYAGTGEGFYNGDAVRGAGVFKSTDGGVTWNQLPSTTPAQSGNWYYVNRLAIKGGVMLAATGGGIYRSTDAGASWTQVSYDRAMDVRFDPNNGNNAVAGGDYGRIYYSTNGGTSWSAITISPLDWLGRVEVAYAKSEPGVVYASVNRNSGEIWKSTDGGKTFNLLSNPGHLGGQGWYDNTIWVDPTNASRIVIGGIDLWRSTDGGSTWTQISDWVLNMYGGMPEIPHADHHVLLADPNYNGTTNRKLYVGNDGGIFRASDISSASPVSGWETLNNGLAITQFYSIAGRTAAGGKVIGGTQDNGSLDRVSGTAWHMFYGGDGGYSAVDSKNDNFFYGEYVYLTLFRTTDRGVSTQEIAAGIDDAGNAANFIAPFILDPNDDSRMLAGGISLWQSLAVKAPDVTWTAIKASIGYPISAVAVAEGDSNVAWVGHNGGQVYRTSNSLSATPTWTRVGAGVLPERMVTRILIDKATPTTVYVAFGGYNSNNLYRTTNNGVTWTNITGTLPAVPIFSIVRHPANASWLYAGTEVGLYTSENGGASWNTSNDGPANVEISELTWMDDCTLLVGTHGRGAFLATLAADNGYTVSGVVRSGNGSGPLLENAKVSLAGKEALTGSNGAFTISGVPQGTFTLTVEKTGYTTYSNANFTVLGNRTGLTISLVPKTYSMSGIVHRGDPDGPPLAYATVSIAGKTATTGATGAFLVTGVPAGTYKLTVSKSGYASYTDAAYQIEANQTGLSFYLVPVYSVSGTVRSGGPSGPLLAGATVTIAGKTATTNYSGAFLFTGIPAESYAITISAPGLSTYNGFVEVKGNTTGLCFYLTKVPTPNLTPYRPSGWSDKIVISKTAGNTAGTGSTFYSTDSLYLNWAVTNSGTGDCQTEFLTELYVDNILSWTWSSFPVAVSAWTYVVDHSLGNLSPGTHSIKIVADAQKAIAEVSEADNTYTKTITVLAPPRYAVTGTVRSGTVSGPVIAGATVQLGDKTVTTSSSGYFSITGVLAGTYTLAISKAGYDTYTNNSYKVSANQGGTYVLRKRTGALSLGFDPKPVTGDRLWQYSITVTETGGVGVTVGSITWEYYDSGDHLLGRQTLDGDYFANWFGFGSPCIPANQSRAFTIYSDLGGRTAGYALITFRGTDENRNAITASGREDFNPVPGALQLSPSAVERLTAPRSWTK